MPAIWLLCALVLTLLVVLVVAMGQRTHDEVKDTVRSFADFREALSPGVTTLRTGAEQLGHRLDHRADASRR